MQLMTGRVDKIMHGERPVEAAAEQFARNFNLVSNRTRLKFSEYLPYLINRVGWLLVIDFGQNTLARHHLSIAMWRGPAPRPHQEGQRQSAGAPSAPTRPSRLSPAVTPPLKTCLGRRPRAAANT